MNHQPIKQVSEGLKQMIRKSLIASTLVLCGTVAFTSAAKAETADVHFTAQVPSSCTFSNVVNGTLGLNLAGTTLDSTLSGTAGTAQLTCNNILATLTADAPAVATAADGYDHSTAVTTVGVTGTGANVVAIAAPGVPTPIPLTGTTDLTVNMSTTTLTPIPSGDYDFFVRLTVAP
ncbi:MULTISPECIES: hypothetical protein [unclassified Coleofasciculus]|uniref:hypothetical protein n=1 Tax=unclassified Coleofasciculus TaxID=2692782 RepID=UPI00188202A8|nr:MULTISPECIES: hypothetical protein [unclassified Coleofasciculus]MBE9126962.1 hypothetical protein [Coleofasciculus sp. LEGE 07081]MBE9150269.1 hypothetical protein [Coleofasciculus sp. LEGE 07092]